MPYRPYPSPLPLADFRELIAELPADPLARLVEQVVEEFVVPAPRPPGKGNPPYDPRLCAKVLIYGYATGTRSSRQLERLCQENIAYLFLTRGDTPSYHTLCNFRNDEGVLLEKGWVGLFAVAESVGVKRVGRIVVDATQMRANASPEAVLTSDEFAPVREELQRILSAAQEVDAREDQEGYPGRTQLGTAVKRTQMRDILRRVRRRLARAKREKEAPAGKPGEPAAVKTPGGAQPPCPTGDGPMGAGEPGTSPEPTDPTAPGSAATLATAEADSVPEEITHQMIVRIQEALVALQEAEAQQLKHACLTDPDARMMGEGREKKIREGHSFEVAVDNGLLVVGQTTQETADNGRLEAVVAAAAKQEPLGVQAVTSDSGFFAGDAVGRLIRLGIDTCVPDTNTACDLHRGEPIGTQQSKTRGSVPFQYEEEADQYVCPEGNVLRFAQMREHYGQRVRVYRAQRGCEGCPLAAQCLTQKKAKHRTLMVGQYQKELAAARERFEEREHQERYRHRGEVVETVFGFVRGTLGYARWLLRGREGVAREGRLLKLAYQIRKVHSMVTTA